MMFKENDRVRYIGKRSTTRGVGRIGDEGRVTEAHDSYVNVHWDGEQHSTNGWLVENVELVPTLEAKSIYPVEVGKKYKRVSYSQVYTCLYINEKGWLASYTVNGDTYHVFKSFNKGWTEVKPERWVIVYYLNSLKNSVQTGSVFFDTKETAEALSNSSTYYAGVCKLV
jgi:hypothetical protein